MAKHDTWAITVPRIIYDAYPDQDLLPIEPPKPGEAISQFKLRAEDAGDTLFLFLCREADDEIDADEYSARLDRALRDIEAVRTALVAGAGRRPSWIKRKGTKDKGATLERFSALSTVPYNPTPEPTS